MPNIVFGRYEGRTRNEDWNITHIETGFAVFPKVPSKAEALRVIYLLKDEDWSFRRPGNVPEDLKLKVQRLTEEAKQP